MGKPKNFFSKVKEAREVLKAKAEELVQLQMKIVKDSIAAGDFESASKANQFLLEHMPDDDGVRVIDISVDKPKQVEGQTGPSIKIGFALGGLVVGQPALPEPAVDIEVSKVDESDAPTDP